MKARGYILIETVVAMTVLAITILGVQRGISQALTARARTMDFTMARFLIEEKTNQLLLQPLVQPGQGQGTFDAPHDRFQFRWSIKRIDIPLPPIPPQPEGSAFNVKALTDALVKYMGKVEVTVSWERSGQKFERVGETLIPGGTIAVAGRTQLWQPEQKEGAR